MPLGLGGGWGGVGGWGSGRLNLVSRQNQEAPQSYFRCLYQGLDIKGTAFCTINHLFRVDRFEEKLKNLKLNLMETVLLNRLVQGGQL